MRQIQCVALAAAMLVACGGSTKTESAGGTSGSGGSGGTSGVGGSSAGGSGGGIPCEGFVPCCDSQGNPVPPICPGGGPAECPPGTTVPPTGICTATGACGPTQPCSATEYCDYPDELCGAGESGKCMPRPLGCDLMYAPVCGCDGQVHGNDCSARAGGTDISGKGGCPAPEGQYGCGPAFCGLGSQYCRHAVSDVGGIPDGWECQPLPAACGKTPTCACMTGEACSDWCTTAALGEVTLTCPGG